MPDLNKFIELANEALWGVVRIPFDMGVRYSVFYLAVTVLLAFLIWRYRNEEASFLRWLLPKSVYTHRSNLLDIKLSIFNRILGQSGLFGALVFIPVVAFWTSRLLSGNEELQDTYAEVTFSTALFVTFLALVSLDFCKYWSHRLMHECDPLWPFHAVHHSAEVLTPLTVSRTHPMDVIVRGVIVSVIVGIFQGVVLYVFVGQVDFITIGGANFFNFFVFSLGANLRHSHIWLSFGPFFEHILVSPAQHQIHHSSAVEHHNKNYGSLFAIWDWAFGTLYIPEKRENLVWGISDGEGNPLPQEHTSMGRALILPFVQCHRKLRGLWPRRATVSKHTGGEREKLHDAKR